MATVLSFLNPSNPAQQILPAASGGLNTIGFYGPGFGLSVKVGEYNETTYRTTEDGQTNGGALPNLGYANVSGAFVGPSIIAEELLEVENTEATLRVRLVTDASVGTQNTRFRSFDKNDINSAPSGVTVQAAEIIKPDPVRGSGDQFWLAIQGSGSVLSLTDQLTPAVQHDWFIGLSSLPVSIGEKTNFAFYFETEFL
ncbi:hypothetical protein E4G67_01710 [Candidatus Bathyarchaeota archaeon]|nr:MAG: hypothetical protein E4G67_01710 [Candidatus Bathyarchaeota archaeon]